jgi:transglutaminase-like putative cysteine protease
VSRPTAFPVLLVIALYGVVGPSPVVAGVLALLSLVPLVVVPRVKASLAAQLVLGAAIFAGVIAVIVTVLAQPHRDTAVLRTPWAAFAGASLALAVSRFYLARPAGGDSVTLAIALAALTACGGAETELVYPVAVILFVVTAGIARRAADPGRAPLAALSSRRHAGALAGFALIGAVIAGLWVVALPPLHQWAIHQLMRRVGGRTGFAESLWLGSLRGLLDSDKKILRVHGEGVDHLRGIVYSRYEGARWARAPQDRMLVTEWPEALEPGAGTVAIDVLEDDPRYYFLPLDAGAIAVSSGVAWLDRSAVLAPIAARPATRIEYRPGDAEAPAHAPPDAGDLLVPSDVRRALLPLAQRWTASASTAEDKLAAIEHRLLSDYRYGLEFERPGRRDPLVEFLLARDAAGRVGHCEYFASAMAVLSRLVGVPARVVGGFQVEEYNSIGGYYIVRERNAHAWVEAYLEGRGWTTFDPTPPSAVERAATTGYLAGVVDLLGAGWSAALNWLDRRTWLEMVGVPLAVLSLPLVVRFLWRRRKKRSEETKVVDAPLPCYHALAAALAAHGVVRGTGETVDQLARRIAGDPVERAATGEIPADVRERGAALLLRYSALRYGGVGDRGALDRDIGAFCRDLARS